MRLAYCVISCDGLGGSIACAWNSQVASSLSQIWVACSTMKNVKLSTRDKEEYTGHEKLCEPKIEEILDGSPIFALHRSAHFFGLRFKLCVRYFLRVRTSF